MKTVKFQLPWIPIVSSVSATVKALFQRLLITKACALQDIVDISRTALFYFSYHLTRHYHSLLCCVLAQCDGCACFLSSFRYPIRWTMAKTLFGHPSAVIVSAGDPPHADQPQPHPQPYITVHKSTLPPERYFNQNFSHVMLQNHRFTKNFFDSGVVNIK